MQRRQFNQTLTASVTLLVFAAQQQAWALSLSELTDKDASAGLKAALEKGALAAVGMAPEAVQAFALEMFSRKASAVATNVPGPQMPLYLGGSKIRDLMFWVPQNGSIGLGISILSYNGAVHFGLIADAKLMPDPDSVIRRFRPEFEKLLYLALMARWEGEFCAEDAEALMHESIHGE